MTQQKTVFITGASSGFGRLAVDRFLAEGWYVFAAMRRATERQALFTDQLKSGCLEILEYDITKEGERAAAIDRIRGKAGSRLDALVNNAGYGLFGPLEDLSEEQLRYQMEVNFFGTILLTRDLLPALRAAKGSIITVSSMLGLHSLPFTSGYCASKFAVEGWMESMTTELAVFGVACYIVEPGGYPTEFGTSIAWAESSKHSVYSKLTAAYQRLRVKVSEQNKRKNPDDVAKLIVNLALRRPKGLRHAVGSDAKAMLIGGRMMPRNLYTRITGFVFLKLLKKV